MSERTEDQMGGMEDHMEDGSGSSTAMDESMDDPMKKPTGSDSSTAMDESMDDPMKKPTGSGMDTMSGDMGASPETTKPAVDDTGGSKEKEMAEPM